MLAWCGVVWWEEGGEEGKREAEEERGEDGAARGRHRDLSGRRDSKPERAPRSRKLAQVRRLALFPRVQAGSTRLGRRNELSRGRTERAKAPLGVEHARPEPAVRIDLHHEGGPSYRELWQGLSLRRAPAEPLAPEIRRLARTASSVAGRRVRCAVSCARGRTDGAMRRLDEAQ